MYNSVKYLSGLLFLFSIISSCSIPNKKSEITLKEFEIICNPSQLDSLYKNFKEEIYIPIQFITQNDTIAAKMRLRGDTSKEYGKKSLKIIFDKNNIPKGEHDKINLNSEWTDKTYLRQHLSSTLMQQAGVVAFKTSFVKLSLNGKYWGLYLQVENVDKTFLKNNKLSSKGNLYKATKDGASLSYFDNIKVKWEKKTNEKEDWNDLQKLINELDTISIANYKKYLENTFEYDRLISIIAMNMLIQNGSTYYHNYYLYHDIEGNGKWQMFPWDMDKTFSFYNYMPYKYHITSSNWESNNPLVEKAFLSKEVMVDIELKIKSLEKKVFNNKNIDPIIKQAKLLLKDAVSGDKTDQIGNEDAWIKALNKEKEFVSKQTNYILTQLKVLPSSFQLERMPVPQRNNITLRWQASKSAKKIKYRLLYGKHFLLEDANAKKIENLTDTSCYLNNLESGLYYWRVYASDGENEIEGFNTKSTFEILPEIVKSITKDTILLKKNSPHFINFTWVIAKGATLTIEPGCKLLLTNSGTIKNYGNIKAIGNQIDSISFLPQGESWNTIENYNNQSALNLTYCNIIDGFIHSFGSTVNLLNCTYLIKNKTLIVNGERVSVIWASKGYFSIDNCYFENKNKTTGEGINIHHAETYVKNSVFKQMADAIEIINVPKGEISGNIVMNSPDDAIDMNGCSNILIKNNIIINNKDKAISVGTEQFGPSTNITIENNFIIGNNCGVGIKDSSFCTIKNTNFINNNTSINAYLKNNWVKHTIGGNAKATNCVFYMNKVITNCDEKSSITIDNSISNDKDILGKNNKTTTIDFIKMDTHNYNTTNGIGALIDEQQIAKLKKYLK